MTDEHEPAIAGAPQESILEANTFEAHCWLARRAIDAEELTLAITHLRLAIELEEAIIARGDRALVERAGRDAWEKASPAARAGALDRLSTLLGDETAMVPMVGQTRAEQPDRVFPRLVAPPIWACLDPRVHGAHTWEEDMGSNLGLRQYRCPGRTVPLHPLDEGHRMDDAPTEVTHLHGTRPASWSPEQAHTERIEAPGHSSATRVCATCGDRWRYFNAPDTSVEPGAYHVDENGQPMVRQLHRPHE